MRVGYEPTYGTSHGPAVFYGYCSKTRRMRMMDYPDYVQSFQDAYSDLQDVYSEMVANISRTTQSLWERTGMKPGAGTLEWTGWGKPSGCRKHPHHHHGCHCGHFDDCHCSCCIRDADVIEYSRCDETRLIPVTLE